MTACARRHMCQSLLKVMRRFLKASSLEDKYGVELSDIPCNDVKLQLSDSELIIGDETCRALGKLKSEKQKSALLGIRSFFAAVVSHMQSKLPLDNTLLRNLGCLNPTKRDKRTTLISIKNVSSMIQPQLDSSIVQDEWKMYQADVDIDIMQGSKDIEEYWNGIFRLQSMEGKSRYQVLPLVIKAALVLAQTNAESERSLSINARVVTKERASLGESAIVGLRLVKEAVRFHDPVNFAPENIPITKELKLSVRSAHAAYQLRLEEEKVKFQKRKDEMKRKREEIDQKEKEKAKLQETKDSLSKTEACLAEQESKAKGRIRCYR